MQIQNALITGSFSYNGADLSNITSSNAYSASLSVRTTDLESTASSLVGASSSFSSILTSVSSSQQQISSSLLNVIAIGATTGSNSFRATQSITGSLTVTGQIIAQTLNVQQVTSSIIYSSGSNNFGCDLNSRQTFTGSFYQTGSVASFSNCVGVGTSAPSQQLTVVGGTTTPGNFSGNYTFGLISGSSQAFAIGNDSSFAYIQSFSSRPLYLNSQGNNVILAGVGSNVGIGTTCPAGKLDVYIGSYQNLIFKAESANQSSLRFNESTNGPRLYSDAATEEFRMQQSYTSTGFLSFYTGPTERMRITCAGNIGINTTNFGEKLNIGCGGAIAWQNTCNCQKWHIQYNSNDGLNFVESTVADFRLFLKAGGNVGMGTATPEYPLHIYRCAPLGMKIQTCGSSFGSPGINLLNGGVDTVLSATNTGLEIGTWSANDVIFRTTQVERMRIASAGNVCIGSAAVSGEILRVTGCSSLDNYISVYSGTIQIFLDADKTNNAGIVGTQSAHPLILRTNGTNKLSISTAGVLDFPGSNSTATSASDSMSFGVSGGSYAWMQTWGGRPLRINELGNNVNAFGTNGYGLVNTTASDVRIKKNIVSIENALDKVNCLRGVYYEFDENNSMCMKVPSGKRRVGLIAQEVGCVLPEALLDSQDDSTPISLDYSGMIGLLTKAIQEQQCTINTLKTCLGIS